MAESLIRSRFCYKSCRVDDLMNPDEDKPVRVQIIKSVELTQAQYRYFVTHLREDMPFIAADREFMGSDSKGVVYCLLVTTRERKDGILVDSQGQDYAQYAAHVANKSDLDLRGVAMEHCNLRLRKPRSEPER